MSHKLNYPMNQTNQMCTNTNINKKCSKQSMVALKSYYHDVTLAFVKDDAMRTIKYTELTQSLSSFLNCLLNYHNSCEDIKTKYTPLHEAMRIYSTKYYLTILNYGNYIIFTKEPVGGDNFSGGIRYDDESMNGRKHECIINYMDILHQTQTVNKTFRAKFKKNIEISKERMLLDLKKALSVPVDSEKAMNIMVNMGWNGGPLGARGDGIVSPIMPLLDLKPRVGLGHVKKAEVRKNGESKYSFMINILKKFLEFLKSDETSTVVSCPRSLTVKDEGFLLNLIKMVNLKRCVTVNDSGRGMVLNQIYEMSRLRSFKVDGAMIDSSHVQFTKLSSFKPCSRVSIVSSPPMPIPSLLPPAPLITNSGEQAQVRYITSSQLKMVDSKYVTPFSPFGINRQSLNHSIFRTTTLIYILELMRSDMHRVEIFFEKILRFKEKGFVFWAVDVVNKGHNRNGAKTKIERYLINELMSLGKLSNLNVAFGHFNVSFILEKIKSKASPKRLKLDYRSQRCDSINTKIDHIQEIFANLDRAFPPLVWSKTNNLSGGSVTMDNNHNDSHTTAYVDRQIMVENTKNITTNTKAISENIDNLIIVKNGNTKYRNFDNARKKIDCNKNPTATVSPYVSNFIKSSDSFRVDGHNNNRNSLPDRDCSNRSQVVFSNSGIDYNHSGSTAEEDKIENDGVDLDYGDSSDIDLTVWTSTDYDSDREDENLECTNTIETKSKMEDTTEEHPEKDNFQKVLKNDSKKEVIQKGETDEVIEERVRDMKINESTEVSCRSKRLRSDSESSDLLFKTHKTIENVTYVSLTYNDSLAQMDDVDFVKKIQTVISLMIDITNELPLLKCHGYRNGALLYSCHSEKSLSWLQTNCIDDDIKFSVTEEVLIESVKMSLKLNCYIDENYKKVFKRLESYNEGLSCSQWVWMKEEKFRDYIIIKFKVDEVSFNYIQGKNFRLFVGIDEAEFSIVWD